MSAPPAAPPPEAPSSRDSGIGAFSLGECPNCGTTLRGAFCHRCGEKKLSPRDLSVANVFHEVVNDFLHLDNRILRTLRMLLTRPGELTRAYFEGGRSKYTKPLTLFVLLNILFFIIQPHTGLLQYSFRSYLGTTSATLGYRERLVAAKLAASGEPQSLYAVRFDARLAEQKKSLLIFSVPVLAGIMKLIYGRRRHYVEHLVFAVHTYAILLLTLGFGLGILLRYLIVAIHPLGSVGEALAHALGSEAGLGTVVFIVIASYSFLALRRAYRDSSRWAIMRAGMIAFTVMMLVPAYQISLFFITLWTT